MRGGGRRQGKESVQERERPSAGTGSRDSDASFCSSRPSLSSVGVGRSGSAVPINDRSYQSSAIRTINAYLSSHSSPTFLKPPLPSAKDITDTLRFILNRLDFPSPKLEEDLPILLKHFNCPIKLNKSALKAPGTPHAWPSLLALIHWLVQIAQYNDHAPNRSILQDNLMLVYSLNSYLHYIQGDDDTAEALDREFIENLDRERDVSGNNNKLLEKQVRDLEAEVEAFKSAPSARDVLEKEKSVLEEDVQKFHSIIEGFSNGVVTLEKGLEDKEKELDAKVQERRRICEENDELKKMIETQTVNSRDVERMKRELQAVERDIAEAELARNAWEEKSWDLDATVGHKLKEIEALSIECNQAIKRLKLGKDFQYMLNAKGLTPAEVLGIDYKSTLKPALDAFADDIKKSSMAKLEELISLQQQSVENAAKVEAKRSRLDALQSRIDEAEAQLNLLKKEVQDYISRCATEAKKMIEDVEAEAHNLDTVEREAEEFLKASKWKLDDAIRQSDEEIQLCARELLALVDSVSKYKEYMESTMSEMKSNLSETARSVSDAYKGSLPAQFGFLFNSSH